MEVYNKTIYGNPAETYLLSLDSNVNTSNSALALNRLCHKLQKDSDYNSFNWSKLTYTSLIKLKSDLQADNYSAGSINTYMSLFKGVALDAWRQKLIATDDYLHIKDIKRVKNVRMLTGRSLPPEEIKNLIKHCSKLKTKMGYRNAAIIALTYGAGLRVHEVANVKMSNFKDGDITIIGKGNKERRMPLPSFVVRILNRWLLARSQVDCDGLFLRVHRGDHILKSQLSKGSIRRIFINVLQQVNSEHFSPHDLRRSYATNLLDANVDLFTVQNLMGHASVDTTRLYDLRGEKTKAIAVKLLPF